MSTLAALEVQLSANVKNLVAGLENAKDTTRALGVEGAKNLKQLEGAITDLRKRSKLLEDTSEIGKYNSALKELGNEAKNIKGLGAITPEIIPPALPQQAANASNQLKKLTSVTQASNQVFREAPAFAFSFQTGLLGISNNLPILTDAFKNARAAGASNVQIFNQLAGALVSPINLIGIGIALLPTLTKLFSSSSESVKEASKEQERYKQSLEKVNSEIGAQIKETATLINFINKSSISTKERSAAIEKLKQINADYFNQLSKEKSNIDDVNKAYDIYISNIFRLAKAKVNAEKVSELTNELLPLGERIEGFDRQLTRVSDKRSLLGLGQLKKDVAELDTIFAKNKIFLSFEEIRRASELTGKSEAELNDLFRLRSTLLTDELRIRGKILSLTSNLETPDLTIETPKRPKKTKIQKTVNDYLKEFDKLYNNEYAKLKREQEQRRQFEIEPPQAPQQIIDNASTPGIETFQEQRRQVLLRAVQRQGIEFFRKNDVRLPITPFLSADELQAALDQQQARIELFGRAVTDLLQKPFDDFFTTLIDGSGNAFDALKTALINIIKQLSITVAKAIALGLILQALGVKGGFGKGFSQVVSGSGFSNLFASGASGGRPFASGGIVTKPTKAIIGERGAEAVIPLNRFNSIAGGLPQGGGLQPQLIPIYRNGELFLQVEQSRRFVTRNG